MKHVILTLSEDKVHEVLATLEADGDGQQHTSLVVDIRDQAEVQGARVT